MTWFDETLVINKHHVKVAHISDSHLFASKQGCYFDVNTAEHFAKTLDGLVAEQVDVVIFGGDLTQDHTLGSYQLFASLIDSSALTCPVVWVPGNHDDIEHLQSISHGQIRAAKRIVTPTYQLLLVNSKGPTPAGWVTSAHLSELSACLDESETNNIVICHHHPAPIQGYLDKHILENGPQLLNVCVDSGKVKALFHGHVHNEYLLEYRGLPIYATPATSIQFSRHTQDWQQQNLGPAYRLISLSQNKMATWVKWA